MIWENRVERLSILGLLFVAGWISCQWNRHLTSLWVQRAHLEVQVRRTQSACELSRRAAIRVMLREQDLTGRTPDWSQIKACPKTEN